MILVLWLVLWWELWWKLWWEPLRKLLLSGKGRLWLRSCLVLGLVLWVLWVLWELLLFQLLMLSHLSLALNPPLWSLMLTLSRVQSFQWLHSVLHW